MKQNKRKENMQLKSEWQLWIVWALVSLIVGLAHRIVASFLTETLLKLSVSMCVAVTFYIVITFVKERKAKKEKCEEYK